MKWNCRHFITSFSNCFGFSFYFQFLKYFRCLFSFRTKSNLWKKVEYKICAKWNILKEVWELWEMQKKKFPYINWAVNIVSLRRFYILSRLFFEILRLCMSSWVIITFSEYTPDRAELTESGREKKRQMQILRASITWATSLCLPSLLAWHLPRPHQLTHNKCIPQFSIFRGESR